MGHVMPSCWVHLQFHEPICSAGKARTCGIAAVRSVEQERPSLLSLIQLPVDGLKGVVGIAVGAPSHRVINRYPCNMKSFHPTDTCMDVL